VIVSKELIQNVHVMHFAARNRDRLSRNRTAINDFMTDFRIEK
jgi:hypothetical protein